MNATAPTAAAYRFDRFTLDLARGALLIDGGAELPLRPKSFALLRLLVENAGRLLDRDTIMTALWPDVVVTDESITQCVRDIRKALGDEAQRLLRTVPRRGYLFAAEVVRGAARSGGKPRDTPGEVEPTGPTPAPKAERRQLTALFCDLADSTTLCGQLDPEDFNEVIRAYQEQCAAAIGSFSGHVAKYMGDGVLAYFGYPDAREDSAERAVRAGLALVAGVAGLGARSDLTLEVRVGVATGLVVDEPTEKGDPRERITSGQPLNLAARLQAMAEPGTVVIADDTRRLVGGLFALKDLGRCLLNGFAAPLPAWRVIGEEAVESRFAALRGESAAAPMVGRRQELGLLLDRWQLAMAGEGQVVLLHGDPGIGKSRLLGELRGRLEQEGARSLRVHCSPNHANSAFYPIIDNFERALRFGREDTAGRKLDRLEAMIVEQHGRPREDVRFIAAMLSIPWEDRHGAAAMTPQKFKDETLRALVDTVEAIARAQPTVTLFEDAHWADPTTLEAMDLLVHRVRHLPLLVVITHRPEFSSPWAQHGHVTPLGLSKLTRAQSAAVVSNLAGGKALPAALLDRILAKADGVPLFVEELTKSVLESAALKEAGDRWDFAGRAETLAVPLTLRDSLMARLDRFTPAKEVAQVGAAIGREFSYELTAAVASHAEPALDRALAQLVGSGLAFQQGTPPDAVYTFKHALVQDAAYDSLLKRRRQELHSKIAGAMEERSPDVAALKPELLAHHRTLAKQPLKAIPLWHRAGTLALERMALAEAIAHLNKGLDLVTALPPSPQRDGMELDLRCSLGSAWMALKGWPAQELWESLHPALRLATSLRRNIVMSPILWGLYVNVFTRGRVAESLRYVTQMLDAAEAYNDENLLVVGHLAAVVSHFHLGNLIAAKEHADRVHALYTEERHGQLVDVLNHDPRAFSMSWATISTSMLGHAEQALQMLDTRDAHARRRAHPFDLGFGLVLSAMVFDQIGEPDAALARLREAERLGLENSLPVLTESQVPIHSGIALVRKGLLVDGVALLKSGLEVWEGSGGKVATPYFKLVLAEGMARLGDPGGALRVIDEIIAQVERPGWEERAYYAEILRIKGWLLSLEDDLEGAERHYLASLDWARRQQAKSWELRTATHYARLLREQGRAEEARDLLAPVYAWFTEGFGTRDLQDAKALLDELRWTPMIPARQARAPSTRWQPSHRS